MLTLSLKPEPGCAKNRPPLQSMIALARELFPLSYMVVRTTTRIRHDETGRAASAQAGFQVSVSCMPLCS